MKVVCGADASVYERMHVKSMSNQSLSLLLQHVLNTHNVVVTHYNNVQLIDIVTS